VVVPRKSYYKTVLYKYAIMILLELVRKLGQAPLEYRFWVYSVP